MVRNFNPEPKRPKVKISVSIDAELNDVVEDIAKEYNLNYSQAINEVLVFFKEEFYEKAHKRLKEIVRSSKNQTKEVEGKS